MLKAGIVGLPNVGKSTLFNALTASHQAESANYPFCTIEPNQGIVQVPDTRLEVLSKIATSKKIIPSVFEFVDIAGLVKGASQGQGLGNQFLAHIREVDAIVQVVRCFEDENVIHVEGSISPNRDLDIITIELALSDADSIEKRLQRLKKGKSPDSDQAPLLEKILPFVKEGQRPPIETFTKEEKAQLPLLQLLCTKPMLIAANVSEETLANPEGNAHFKAIQEYAKTLNMSVVPVSIQIESELVSLPEEEKAEFLDSLGITDSGVNSLIRASYALLGLETYFTVGPQETRAWPFEKGLGAPACAGIIHTDFERGFIRAEVVAYDDYVACAGEKGAREKGQLRQEGKEYIMKDGDVVHFLFNV